MGILKIRNLVKKYNNVPAVDNISLEVKEGEIFGLLGPNGAGKSTTINSVCGLVRMDLGEITVDGVDLRSDSTQAKKKLGLVPQEIAVFDNLTARENVEFFGKLAGLRGPLLKERTDEALEFAGLSEKQRGMPKAFSGGMKRRLNIACALTHHPRIIIMDEPTVGIDPQSRNHILESVKRLNGLGSTIIYTSHYMEEIEAVCGRIAIMDHGRIIAEGTCDELRNSLQQEDRILIDVSGAGPGCVNEIKSLPAVRDVAVKDGGLEIKASNTQLILQDVLFILSRSGARIRGIDVVEPDLETVFLSLTGKMLRDGEGVR